MKEEIKKQWVAALRSGDYTQGRGYLRAESPDGDTYCCLGVLCDLAERANVVESERTPGVQGLSMVRIYDGEKFALPDSVVSWAGLDTDEPTVNVALHTEQFSGGQALLTSLNDYRGYTFEQIADLIEEQL